MFLIKAFLCASKSFSEMNCEWDLFHSQEENQMIFMSILKMD